ncbi:MAG: SDR family oxidoreductase [bacterium]|nr:SDR family oxidoreductase [bacterium]
MQLKNAKVLVTGGSDGYGRGIAAVLKKAGAEVWITGRNVEKLEKATEELGVRTIQADASSGADWDRVMRETGELDVLVNNAGFGGKIVPVAEQTDEDIIRTIGTNLTGVVLGCRRAGAMMAKRKRGIIINISSVCALYAWPAWSVYTAAKAGVAKFSHGLYTELRPHGVRVSCVTPSWGQTGFNHAANISGASENPELAAKCIAPEELGNIVRSIIEQPDHLAVPDITVQPVIQDISPM